MKTYLKRSICFILAVLMALSLSACSGGTEMSEKNITKTILKVEKALRDFDYQTLEKYVSSKTLQYIITLAKEQQQFSQLGQSMFEELSMDVKSIDLDAKTVTVLVRNRDLSEIGAEFANELTSNYSTFQLLSKLTDQTFLDESLSKLTAEISEAIIPDNPTEITLSITTGDKNLVLVFDENAEDAVSGGAVSAIKNTISGNLNLLN